MTPLIVREDGRGERLGEELAQLVLEHDADDAYRDRPDGEQREQSVVLVDRRRR